MSAKDSYKPMGPLDPAYITKVYVPSALLVFVVAYVKANWTPFAVAAAAILAGLQFYGNQVQKVLDPVKFQNFPLIEKKVLSHNTAIYRFGLPSKKSILGLPIGQHISLGATVPVTDPKTGTTERRQVVRSYTPISSDHDFGHFDLLIKSYPTGNISKHLAGLNIGDKMAVKGPKGAMVYTPGMVKRFGMIAGGTGITPMLQVIKAIVRGRSSGDDTQVALIFANVNEGDILMKDELDRIVAQDDRIRVHYVLNNPPENWTGSVGFVTQDIITAHLPSPSPDMKLLICGPPPMVASLKKSTEALGYSKARPVSKLEDQVFCF